jgi:hypothetical protein
MISFFGIDLTDRILHELELKVNIMYYRISIPLETFSLFGDFMLLCFLLLPLAQALMDHAVVSEQRSTFFRLGHKCFCSILLILFVADRITFIYGSLTVDFIGPSYKPTLASSGASIFQISGAYPKLNVTFYGLYLAGAISFTAITVSVLLRLKRVEVLHKTFLICLPLIFASIAVRSIVNFVYALIFKLLTRPQSHTTQLIHMVFYGFLSLAIYIAILKLAATEEDWDSVVSRPSEDADLAPFSSTSYGETDQKAG